jgi:arsenate reductase
MSDKPIRVLFLCVGNACRSQMAEAILRHVGGDQFDVHSAGAVPSGVWPMTLRALAEVGIDAGRQRSKHWNVYLDAPPFDYVITLCDPLAHECPVFPGAGQRLHWPFDDPAAAIGSEDEQMAVFRRVRDEIAEQIQRFVRGAKDRHENAE